MKHIVSAEYISTWFARNWVYGVPTNNDAITEAFNAALHARIKSDPTQAYYDMAVTSAYVINDMLHDYCAGKIEGPRPEFDCAQVYSDYDADMPAIGETVTGEAADDLADWIISVPRALDEYAETLTANPDYPGKISVCAWHVVAVGDMEYNDDGAYVITRLNDIR